MIILPKRATKSRPTVTFYFASNRIVLSTAATKKIDAHYGDKLAVFVDANEIKLIFRHDGFHLSRKTGSETMLHINSADVCEKVKEFYANDEEKTISFLIGTRENNLVEVITSSKKTLKTVLI